VPAVSRLIPRGACSPGVQSTLEIAPILGLQVSFEFIVPIPAGQGMNVPRNAASKRLKGLLFAVSANSLFAQVANRSRVCRVLVCTEVGTAASFQNAW
jgi:hypothetical protein